jgi:hypothetical protein
MYQAARTKIQSQHLQLYFRLAAMLIVTLLAWPTAAAPYSVTAVSLDEDNLDIKAVGGLSWRGGIAITMSDRRFGGLSALQISRDGQRLTAVTDRGHWFQAELEYRSGILSGLRAPRLRPLLDLEGNALARRWNDAEALANAGPNGLVVAFERVHRLWRYDGAPDPTLARARRIAPPGDLSKLPNNGGIEAMTRLCDGTLLAIAEQSRTRREFVPGWIISGSNWQPLRYRTAGALRPTGAATLPDCDVIFVERSFSFLTGLDIRISRIAASAIVPGADLVPKPVARLSNSLTIDNFEGIAARRNAAGDTLIYILSDDNFSPLQRTLLFMFRLDGD